MSDISTEKMKQIFEAALMVAGKPLTVAALQSLFGEDEARPDSAVVKECLKEIKEQFENSHSGLMLCEVSSGYRFQTKPELSPWLSRLWEERAPRYSRAFLETLALIAYKQPITRAEIEEIRGVTVNSNIVKALLERDWIREIGYRDLPGKPAILGTTKTFLDYFNVKSLAELPTLAEFKSLEDQEVQVQLALEQSDIGPSDSDAIPAESAVVEIEQNTEDDIEEKTSNVVTLEIENKADNAVKLEAEQQMPEETTEDVVKLHTDEDHSEVVELNSEEYNSEEEPSEESTEQENIATG